MVRARVLIVATFVLSLAACAAPAAVVLPDGVTASLFQNRFDYSLRQMEIKVSNDTDAPITVTRAALESSLFTEPAVWDRPQQIPAGSARDLKVLLADPVCDNGEPTLAVQLDFTLDDGTTGTASILPTDPTGRIDTVNDQDCLGISVAERVTITAPAAAPWTPGAHGPAVIDIAVESTGEGSVTFHQAKGTVLLALVNGNGVPEAPQSVGLVVDAATEARVIRLLVVPSRCDPHAVAEDKRGTFFPLDVETDDGRSGTIYVGVSDEVRGSLYDFFGDYCGLP